MAILFVKNHFPLHIDMYISVPTFSSAVILKRSNTPRFEIGMCIGDSPGGIS